MTDYIADMIQHAKEAMPNEACGLLVQIGNKCVVHRARNISMNPREGFAVAPEDYLAATERGKVLGIYHSHPYGLPVASMPDLAACEIANLPFHIVSVPVEGHAVFYPSGYKAPLIGRPFKHGVLDCYTVIKDWYAAHRVTIPDFEREEVWWEKGGNLYLENFAAAGFSRTTDALQYGDVILMQYRSPVPNHAAVFVGESKILHHLTGRLSGVDVWGGYWEKFTTHIVRHKQWEILPERKPLHGLGY